MERTPSKAGALKGYKGANPFRASQARDFKEERLLSEFYATTFYWSLFNEQNEILIGSRGSGKTIILKMLCYSRLRKLNIRRARELVEAKRFIGFYVPIRVEFLALLRNKPGDNHSKIDYFCFSINCIATQSLIREVDALLIDQFPDSMERLMAERRILNVLTGAWFGTSSIGLMSLRDLEDKIERLYQTTPFWNDGQQPSDLPLARMCFQPIVGILYTMSEILGLDAENVTWIACLDEAEFLGSEYLRAINTVFRSEKRPLTVKLATLPFYHSTRETLIPGTFVESEGHDFKYRTIDLPPDSEDFVLLADHLCKARFSMVSVPEIEVRCLLDFVGRVGDDTLIDIFHYISGARDDVALEDDVLSSLSSKRQETVDSGIGRSHRTALLKRFKPIYFYRQMKRIESRGGTVTGWYSGVTNIRKISDGNPRRLLQVLDALFEAGRKQQLTEKVQHQVHREFADKEYERSAARVKDGYLLKELLERLCCEMANRVHGEYMTDAGTSFRLSTEVLKNKDICAALKEGTAFAFIFCDDGTIQYGLSERSALRVANICAVKFWVPMRSRAPLVLKGLQGVPHPDDGDIGLREAEEIFEQAQLTLISDDSN